VSKDKIKKMITDLYQEAMNLWVYIFIM
jgi:uncharacterized protein YqfB (UPF0267 family)